MISRMVTFSNVRSTAFVVIGLVLIVVVVVVAENLWSRRAGYPIPGRTAVRCDAGHVFRTTWVQGGSLSAIRLGPLLRYGRCPVGHHWSRLRPVKDADLTDSQRRTLDSESDA